MGQYYISLPSRSTGLRTWCTKIVHIHHHRQLLLLVKQILHARFFMIERNLDGWALIWWWQYLLNIKKWKKMTHFLVSINADYTSDPTNTKGSLLMPHDSSSITSTTGSERECQWSDRRNKDLIGIGVLLVNPLILIYLRRDTYGQGIWIGKNGHFSDLSPKGEVLSYVFCTSTTNN